MTTSNTICEGCRNGDAGKAYSNWHYCTNPKNFKEFTIIRTACDFTGEKYEVKGPFWCPKKKL